MENCSNLLLNLMPLTFDCLGRSAAYFNLNVSLSFLARSREPLASFCQIILNSQLLLETWTPLNSTQNL